MKTTSDPPRKPRPEWLLLSAWDRRYVCRWCPFEASIPSLRREHEQTRCTERPMEEDPDGRE